MRISGGGLPLWALAALLFLTLAPVPYEGLAQNSSGTSRFLVIVETSKAMQRRSAGTIEAVKGLLESKFGGQYRDSDTLHLLTFNESVYTGPLGLTPEQLLNYLNLQTTYEKRAKLESALPEMHRLISQSARLVVVLVTCGDSPIRGTPFDGQINQAQQQWFLQQQKARMPIVTVLQAEQGVVKQWSVTPSPAAVEMDGAAAKASVASGNTSVDLLEAMRKEMENQISLERTPEPKPGAPERLHADSSERDAEVRATDALAKAAPKKRPVKNAPESARMDKRFADPAPVLGASAPASTPRPTSDPILPAPQAKPVATDAGAQETNRLVMVPPAPTTRTNQPTTILKETNAKTELAQTPAVSQGPPTNSAHAQPAFAKAAPAAAEVKPTNNLTLSSSAAESNRPQASAVEAPPKAVRPVEVSIRKTDRSDVVRAREKEPAQDTPAAALVPQMTSEANTSTAVLEAGVSNVQTPPQIPAQARRRSPPAEQPVPASASTPASRPASSPAAAISEPAPGALASGKDLVQQNFVWLVLLFLTGMGASYCFFMWLQTYLKPRINAPPAPDLETFEAVESTVPQISSPGAKDAPTRTENQPAGQL